MSQGRKQLDFEGNLDQVTLGLCGQHNYDTIAIQQQQATVVSIQLLTV